MIRLNKYEIVKEWRRKNPEKVKAQNQRYWRKHRKELNAKGKKYYELHKEKLNAYGKEYYLRNKDKIFSNSNKWSREHRDKRNIQERKYYWKIKTELYKVLGDKCANPYNKNHGDFLADTRCLQIDHVNGGGSKEIKKKNRSSYYLKILKEVKSGSKEYQLLCANCNWIKRYENGEL